MVCTFEVGLWNHPLRDSFCKNHPLVVVSLEMVWWNACPLDGCTFEVCLWNHPLRDSFTKPSSKAVSSRRMKHSHTDTNAQRDLVTPRNTNAGRNMDTSIRVLGIIGTHTCIHTHIHEWLGTHQEWFHFSAWFCKTTLLEGASSCGRFHETSFWGGFTKTLSREWFQFLGWFYITILYRVVSQNHTFYRGQFHKTTSKSKPLSTGCFHDIILYNSL